MNIALASELDEASRHCTCCGKRLCGKVRYLELDQRTNTYHDHGGIPEGRSQGWFPFGLACARRMLREHEDA